MVLSFLRPEVQRLICSTNQSALDRERFLIQEALDKGVNQHFSCKRDGVSRSIYVVGGKVFYGLKQTVGKGGRATVKKAEYDGRVIARRIQRITNDHELCKARKTQALLERLKGKIGIEQVIDVIEYPKTITTKLGQKLDVTQRVTFSELQECDLCEIFSKRGKDLTREMRYSYLDQLFSALQVLEGAHGDLKPENILVTGEKLTLSDFEEYHDLHEKGPHQRGSPWWMAPEAFLKQSVDVKKLDVWALGMIAFYLFIYPELRFFPWFQVAGVTVEDQNSIYRQMTDDNVFRVIDKAYDDGLISLEQQSLISFMMCVNPKERWTLDQAADYFRKEILKGAQ